MVTIKRRHKVSLIILLIVSIVCLLAFHYIQVRASFENHFLEIMKELNSPENRTQVRSWFEKAYNFTELYEWVHENLQFVPFGETFERYTDPAKILQFGKGRCEEFSILYVATCLAHGYKGRLVAAADISLTLYVPHVWAEVELDSCWVHVDPSEQKWNKTCMYQSWKWGEDIGSKIRIYAFDHEGCEDVTMRYECD